MESDFRAEYCTRTDGVHLDQAVGNGMQHQIQIPGHSAIRGQVFLRFELRMGCKDALAAEAVRL